MTSATPSPTPFKISVPDSKLTLLQKKLSLGLSSLPSSSSKNSSKPISWERGTPLTEIQRLATAWQSYDWRAVEATLNRTPQFTLPISVDGFDSISVHFVWQRSKNPRAVPLLFVHGWPGSFMEVLKILELLRDSEGDGDAGPAFDIVAPSMPNFGFSDGVEEGGFGMAQHAECLHKLMLKLGYPEYVTQGGDLGFSVTRAMGILYPESVKASHINMIPALAPTWWSNPLLAFRHAVLPYSEKERKGLERTQWFLSDGYGYNHEQSTKPETLAYALNDPIAILAWIVEKLHDWSDNFPWTDHEILTWVSLYLLSTAGPGAAHRIYYEATHSDDARAKGLKFVSGGDTRSWVPKVKLGLTWNPREIFVMPRYWGGTLGKVVFESENETGGHFYAHERPEWLARDLRAMFGKNGGAFGVVKGRDGY